MSRNVSKLHDTKHSSLCHKLRNTDFKSSGYAEQPFRHLAVQSTGAIKFDGQKSLRTASGTGVKFTNHWRQPKKKVWLAQIPCQTCVMRLLSQNGLNASGDNTLAKNLTVKDLSWEIDRCPKTTRRITQGG